MRINNKKKTKGKRIYIANLISISGGTLVLSVLCAYLRKFGYDAKLLIRDYPQYGLTGNYLSRIKNNIKIVIRLLLVRLGLLPNRYKNQKTTINIPELSKYIDYKIFPPFNKKDAIIIYPEIIFGNPFKIKNVVRYLLYHHKFYSKQNSYTKSDKFVAYRGIFNDKDLNPTEIILKLRWFDKQLYRQYNFGERKGKCYILYKGASRKDIPKEFDGKVFSTIQSQEELVATLNECKYCYSYDPHTFYNTISAICGCIPIIVPEPGKTAKDYLSEGEMHYGKAYGDSQEQIEFAIKTRDKLLESLDYEQQNIDNILTFVKFLEANFGALRRIQTNNKFK